MEVPLLSAVEQLSLLHNGKISPEELAEEHIRRIERLNPHLNAFVDFDADRVRHHAQAPSRGRLSGLPITVKSSIEVSGHRCEIGSVLRHGITASQDAEAVSKLRSAGAVVIGTTNCPEFLMAYETDNLLTGRTNNPWDLKRSAGGSSGGESAAIAAGLSAGGIGSDSGGSVREPAHFTGICSLKPTPGRVSSAGHQPPCIGPFSSLGAVGPMARTIPDIDLLFQVLCEEGESKTFRPSFPYKPVSLESAKQVSIGWFEDDGFVPVTQETRDAVRSAAKELARQGFRVSYFRPSLLEDARRLWRIFFLQCGAMFYASTIDGRREELSPIFKDFLRDAEAETPLTAASLLQAWAETDLLRVRFQTEMSYHSILITPVCSIPAFHHGERLWDVDGQTVGYWDVMRYTQWFNLLACPAAVVPVGQSSDGLPIGVQIAGLPMQDELVLAVAGALDQAFGFRPPTYS